MTTNWKPPSSSSSFAFFYKCSRWWRASLACLHLFAFFCVADDSEPGGSLSFFSLFLKCKRRWRTKQAHRHLLHLSKKTRMKKKQIKRKVDVHLLATDALVFLGGTFSTTPFQQRLLQHYFNTAFATLLQHTYATLSFAITLQHCFCSTIFCNIAFALEWRRGLRFLMGGR